MTIRSSFYPECDLKDKNNYKRMFFIKRDGSTVEKVILDVIDPFHRETLIFTHYMRHLVRHFIKSDVGFNVISRDQPWDFRVETNEKSTFNIEITSIAESYKVFNNHSSEERFTKWKLEKRIPLHELIKLDKLFPNKGIHDVVKDFTRLDIDENDLVVNPLYSEERSLFISKLPTEVKTAQEVLIQSISKKAAKKHVGKEQTVIVIDNRSMTLEMDDFYAALPSVSAYCETLEFPEVWLYTGHCSDDDGNNADFSFIPIKVRRYQEEILDLMAKKNGSGKLVW
ncbi:hypothetical protein ACED25_23045 [Vibrio sp. 1F263]|uniref:hypothetical protein n=1 Tax=Vibrio sp. 1F263 TaxID=3230012 RepID=UPI00352F5D01